MEKITEMLLWDTGNDLISAFSGFDEQTVNKKPTADSWTPAQVIGHLQLSIGWIADLLNGPGQATRRDPDMLTEKFKKDFLDFSVRMQAPAFITPEDHTYDKDDLTHEMRRIWNSLCDVYKSLDLTETIAGLDMGYGLMTRTELLAFAIYHTQRHIHQLHNMKGNTGYNI